MPDTRSSLICVPDTSSLIHLRDVEAALRVAIHAQANDSATALPNTQQRL